VQVAIEQGHRQVVGQPRVVLVRDAVDEQVGVEHRHADHRQHFAGARIDGDGGAILVAAKACTAAR
jgi:hypothetical protein